MADERDARLLIAVRSAAILLDLARTAESLLDGFRWIAAVPKHKVRKRSSVQWRVAESLVKASMMVEKAHQMLEVLRAAAGAEGWEQLLDLAQEAAWMATFQAGRAKALLGEAGVRVAGGRRRTEATIQRAEALAAKIEEAARSSRSALGAAQLIPNLSPVTGQRRILKVRAALRSK